MAKTVSALLSKELCKDSTPGTESQFGYEWNIYREILPIYREQFERWISPLRLSEFAEKSFLDAGCGIGRNAYWALQAGAKEGVAFDFDQRTVEVARANLQIFPQCLVEYRSIYEIEYSDKFDIVFCIGVLHHLADPRRALAQLVKALKPEGKLLLWVYAREGNELYLKIFNPLRKYVTALLPLWLTRRIAQLLTVALSILLIFPIRSEYLRLLKKMSFRHRESIVFDQLLPKIACYWKKEELLNLVDGLPLTNIEVVHTNGMSWSLVAKKTSRA